MLTQITVQGFKSLYNVQDLDLGNVNVFIGANGSGKSNLLEAVGFLGAAASGQLDDQALMRRGVRPGVLSLCRSSLEQVPTRKGIRIGATWQDAQLAAEYEIQIDDNSNAQRQPWSHQSTYWTRKRETTKEPDPQFISALSDYAIFSPNTSTLRGVKADITQRLPVGLAGGQLAEVVDELLEVEKGSFGDLDLDELLELLDWVDEISVELPSRKLVSPSVPTMRNIIRFTDRWMAKGRNQLSAYDASEGALYVLFALVLALHPKSPRLFAIENLDQAMHPRLARATVRLFCRQMLQATPSRQALLTTHNPLVLDGLDLRDGRIRLFTVERDSRGATRVDRVQVSEEILQATQEGLSLANLWVMGRLGGVPDIF